MFQIQTDSLTSQLIVYAIFYIGCLTNPFLYVVSSKAIRASLRRITKKRRPNGRSPGGRRQVFSDVGFTTRREEDGVVALPSVPTRDMRNQTL